MGKDKLQEIIEKYEASDDELDLENRLRYAMALSMHFGKEVNTPEMKSILTTLTASGHQTAKKDKSQPSAAVYYRGPDRERAYLCFCQKSIYGEVRDAVRRRERRLLTSSRQCTDSGTLPVVSSFCNK